MTAFGVPRTVLAGENGAHRLADHPSSRRFFLFQLVRIDREKVHPIVVAATLSPYPHPPSPFSPTSLSHHVHHAGNSVPVALGKIKHPTQSFYQNEASVCRGRSQNFAGVYYKRLFCASLESRRCLDRSRPSPIYHSSSLLRQ